MFGVVSVDEEFQEAADVVATGTFRVSQDDQLRFYALYKQATVGPCTTPAPGFFDFSGKAKWNAWKALGDMEAQDAKLAYVDHLQNVLSRDDDPNRKRDAWVAQSQPIFERENIDDSEKKLSDWVVEGNKDKATCEGFIFVRDDEGRTALHWAADSGRAEIAALLLDYNANVNAQDAEGQTALHYAATCEHVDVIEVLVSRGADLTLKDKQGESSEDLMDENVYKSVAAMTIKS